MLIQQQRKRKEMGKNRLASAFAMAFLLGCSSKVPISITNESGHALRNVTVSGSGFRQNISLIPTGDTTTLYVVPKGESGVAVAFNLGEKRYSYAEDGYFEAGHHEVAVTVNTAGRASVHSELRSLLSRLVGRW
jgi:hypothetical protein